MLSNAFHFLVVFARDNYSVKMLIAKLLLTFSELQKSLTSKQSFNVRHTNMFQIHTSNSIFLFVHSKYLTYVLYTGNLQTGAF